MWINVGSHRSPSTYVDRYATTGREVRFKMTLASPGPEAARRQRLRVPHYQVGEVARYGQLASATIVSWQQKVVSARDFGAELSYLQLIDVAVVAAMRHGGIRMPEIRATRVFMQDYFKAEYPF